MNKILNTKLYTRFLVFGYIPGTEDKNMQTKKNDLGVSPVIAVILMVAITVVLAGVVFLWAQSFTEDAGGGAKTLSVDLELIRDAGVSDTLTITPLKGNIDWTDYQLIFNGAAVDTAALSTTNVGIGEDIVVGAGVLIPGQEYTVKMVFVEDQSVVLDTDVICKAA